MSGRAQLEMKHWRIGRRRIDEGEMLNETGEQSNRLYVIKHCSLHNHTGGVLLFFLVELCHRRTGFRVNLIS